MEKARIGADNSSTYSYISEVETRLDSYMINNGGNNYSKGLHTVDELKTDLKAEVKGKVPSEGNICIGDNGNNVTLITKGNIGTVSYIDEGTAITNWVKQ